MAEDVPQYNVRSPPVNPPVVEASPPAVRREGR